MTKSKGPRRKLTPFLCQEMLYEYATDRLDTERRAAVDEFLKTDKESREILAGILEAIEYTKQMAQVEPSIYLLELLRESENVVSLGRRYSSWKEWPDVMRWSVVCILLVVSLAAVISSVPWSRLKALAQKNRADQDVNSVEIAKIEGPNPLKVFASGEAPLSESAQNETSGDEEMEESGDGGDDVGVDAGPAMPVAPPAPVKVAATPVAVVARPAPPPEKKTGGFVYRAFMILQNLEELGPKITGDIEELGGEKAGDVELGWKRGSGRYYHFVLPESNEEKLLERLRAYGPVRISKDPHPRAMPPGQVRFILWVEPNS